MTEISKEIQLKFAKDMRETLIKMLDKTAELREDSRICSELQEPLADGTKEIAEIIIDMIYILCDFIGENSSPDKE